MNKDWFLNNNRKWKTGLTGICKYCKRGIIFDDPHQDGFNQWHVPVAGNKGPWWQCQQGPILPKIGQIHEPELKEDLFDKIYKRLVL